MNLVQSIRKIQVVRENNNFKNKDNLKQSNLKTWMVQKQPQEESPISHNPIFSNEVFSLFKEEYPEEYKLVEKGLIFYGK